MLSPGPLKHLDGIVHCFRILLNDLVERSNKEIDVIITVVTGRQTAE